MKTGKEYNGWKNYETWNVALWLGNDEGLYHAARDFARQYKGRINGEAARDFVMELMPQGTPDFNGKPGRYFDVHWPSIARALVEMRA